MRREIMIVIPDSDAFIRKGGIYLPLAAKKQHLENGETKVLFLGQTF